MALDINFSYEVLRHNLALRMRRTYLKPNYRSEVSAEEVCHTVIENILTHKSKAMLCRWGATELAVIVDMLKVRKGLKKVGNDKLAALCTVSGFFPNNVSHLERFTEIMLSCFAKADCVGVWRNSMYNPLEDYVVNAYAPQAKLVPLVAMCPCQMEKPWSSVLAGKKVVVVHPFARSIEKQYLRRELLFSDAEERLPEFRLQTIQAVQSLAGERTPFQSWFDALQHMCDQLSDSDFDIALIGAGAYGLPLAAHVKDMGKQGIHVGGALQLLFGIMGRRWESMDIPRMCKKYWVRPDASEIIVNKEAVENSCYW